MFKQKGKKLININAMRAFRKTKATGGCSMLMVK